LGVPRRTLLLTAFLLTLLVSSLFTYMFVNDSSATSLETVHVKNETELKNAISNAPTGKPITIALDNDITLTVATDDYNSNYYPVSIIIPADKDITLTSNKANGYYKLIGAVNCTILFVAPNGILRIDGISVTHTSNTVGGGVAVYTSAEFYLYSGKIFGNTGYDGYGVSNSGIFVMSGGIISDNTAEVGGGVYNSGWGTFIMTGGTISGNKAIRNGGGVNNEGGNFSLSSGKISNNVANYGGGVYIGGGGLHMIGGEFIMSGGEISGNKAFKQGGGIFNSGASSFVMSDGTISGNSAEEGGGVYHGGDVFTMSGGKITDNTANLGGGVYVHNNYVFNRRGGVISGNIATNKGNNVYPDVNGGESGSNGSCGSSDTDGFSLRVIVLIFAIVVSVVVCVLFFYFKKKITQMEAKFNALSQGNLEV